MHHVVRSAEVNHCEFQHCEACEDQDASEVGLKPHRVLYGWQDLVNTWLEVYGDQDCSDG